MAETNVTRMSSDYADNELELFRKTVSSLKENPAQKHFVHTQHNRYKTLKHELTVTSLLGCPVIYRVT